jgi:hypothetical protein
MDGWREGGAFERKEKEGTEKEMGSNRSELFQA